MASASFSTIQSACLDFCTICCVLALLKVISRTKSNDGILTQNSRFYPLRIYCFVVVAVAIFISISFQILKCGIDDLFSYNFDSKICILTKYFGGVNLANMSSTITSQVKCFLQNYMCELLKAMKDDGCNVIGYSAWSLMDNFEWTNGYT